MRRARGFTYLFALFAIAFMGVASMAIGTMWQTVTAREREAELLFVGNQYRSAIERFYRAGQGRYPRSLQELLKDPRQPMTQRYLRKLYPDPITGSSEWGIVKGPDGGVMGIYSLSEDAPLKTSNFRAREATFEGSAKYADWKFIYTPRSGVKPAATPPAPSPAPSAAGAVTTPPAPAPAAK